MLVSGVPDGQLSTASLATEKAGKQSVAVEYYRKLLDIEPNNSATRNYLAKHDDAGKTTTPPPDDVGELMPVGGKKKSP